MVEHACGAIRPKLGSVITASLQSQTGRDVIAAIHDPAQAPATAPGKILVYHNLPNGDVLTGVADGLGRVEVLRERRYQQRRQARYCLDRHHLHRGYLLVDFVRG